MSSAFPMGRVATFSRGIARIPHLAAMLDAEEVSYWPRKPSTPDHVVGWGRKANTALPRRFADALGLPFVSLEDGFLRSVGLGVEGAQPLSVVVDSVGVHYDATHPSELERMLAFDGPADPLDDPALLTRARACIARIRAAGLSKYNQAPNVDLGPRERPRVLVVDQSAGDLSLTLGGCAQGGFERMLRTAIETHPDAEILVKTHPDVLSGKRAGNLLGAAGTRVRLLTRPQNPAHLLGQVDHVFVMTSLMGCEALLAGLPVTCFGAPFYAGWGLTKDLGEVPVRRGRERSVEQLFAAAYLRYARYIDPETGERCEAERVIEHLSTQRAFGAEQAERRVCVGFSAWKRSFLPRFVGGPQTDLRFARGARDAARALDDTSRAALIVWGVGESPSVGALAEERGVPIWRMEDGFLRSVGLGSDLYAPASLVLDRRGVYYDPARPSDLEHILQESTFEPEELARAAALRRSIVAAGLSKYNVGEKRSVGPPKDDPRRVVLVVGQVEDDASIERGCLDIRRNEDLLRAAREAQPRAYVLYKPHPDVVSGNRRDSLPLKVARCICDEVVVNAKLADCLARADEVHTMTSLVGFEALLRELTVVVYGQPFYAGWGLTRDRHRHPRRTRTLSLDALVAGTLLRYPLYVHPTSGALTTPERIVTALASAVRSPSLDPRSQNRWRLKLLNLGKELLGVA